MRISSLRLRIILVSVLLLAGLLGVAAYLRWDKQSSLPAPGSRRYEQYVVEFQLGTAKLDVTLTKDAIDHLTKATDLVPKEPAAWVNRGLAYLRSNQREEAAADLKKAAQLAPNQPEIEEARGYLAEQNGDAPGAIAHFQKALESEPDNIRWLFKLSRLLEIEGGSDADKRRQDLLEKILQRRPTSLPVLAARAALATRRGDRKLLQDTLDRLSRVSSDWKQETRAQLAKVRTWADDDFDFSSADFKLNIAQFGNLLMGEPGYARSAGELVPGESLVGTTLQQFIKLAPMHLTASPPDRDLRFTAKELAGKTKKRKKRKRRIKVKKERMKEKMVE